MSINNNSSENALDLLFEYSPDLIFIHDLKGNIANMNKNLMKALGYKNKETILKLQIKDILNYDNKDFILSKFLKLILNKSKHTDYYFKTKRDSHIPVEGFGFPYKMRNIDVIVNISTIISDKKKLQKELFNTKSQLDNILVKIPEIRLWALSQKKDSVEILQKGGIVLKESEKKYKEILESIKEGYFEVDLEGNIVFFNNSLCEILEYSPEELVGKNYRTFMELENEELDEFINIEEIDGKAFEFELIKKNREKIYVESSLYKKQNSEGLIVGFYGLIRDVSKRKEAENKLKNSEQSLKNLNLELEQRIELRTKELSESEEKYRLISDNANDIISVFDENFKLQYINEVQQKISGFSEEEVMKKSPIEFMHPDDIKKTLKIFKDTLKAGTGNGEFRMRCKDGSYVWLEVSGKRIYDTNNKSKLIVISRDISERKLIEQKLRESETKYRNLIETTPALIQSVRTDGSFVFVNQTWLDTFGYTREEVQSIKLTDIIHPESQQHCQYLFSKIMTGESVSDIHATFVSKDGKPIFVEGNVNPYFTDDKVISTRGIFHNITERKNAEQKVKESEEKYRSLINNISDVIMEVDLGNVITYVSPQINILLGYSIEEVIGMKISDLILSDDLPTILEGMKQALKDRTVFSIEYRLRHKEGYYVPVISRGSLVRIGDNVKFIGVIRDISKRKIAEEKLKESENRYRKAYNRVNFYKELFTHDISNIIQNLSASIELHQEFNKNIVLSKNLKDLLYIFERQIVRGKKLISNVRKLSEIEDSEITLKPTEICEVLKNAIDFISNSFQESQINIQIDSFCDMIHIKANELLLEVFENILLNSVKYNENPAVEIFVKLSRIQENKNKYLKLEFIDNGIGVEDYRKETIFKKGRKDHKGGKGMGLGLSLVSKILRLYNGKIWVEDKIKGDYSKGSNFIVIIPIDI